MLKSMFKGIYTWAARGSLCSLGIQVGSPCLDSAVERDAVFVLNPSFGCYERSYRDRSADGRPRGPFLLGDRPTLTSGASGADPSTSKLILFGHLRKAMAPEGPKAY